MTTSQKDASNFVDQEAIDKASMHIEINRYLSRVPSQNILDYLIGLAEFSDRFN
jgi:hypothetical protein